MYNRYTPQPDGSYQRTRYREEPASCQADSRIFQQRPLSKSPLEFFREFLPRNFDTSDLLIMLLILLMTGRDEEDRSTALLTLAIYLFL